MVAVHTPGPFVVALLLVLIGIFVPSLITTSLAQALPFGQAVSAAILLGFIGGASLWAVTRISIRTASAIEGGDD